MSDFVPTMFSLVWIAQVTLHVRVDWEQSGPVYSGFYSPVQPVYLGDLMPTWEHSTNYHNLLQVQTGLILLCLRARKEYL